MTFESNCPLLGGFEEEKALILTKAIHYNLLQYAYSMLMTSGHHLVTAECILSASSLSESCKNMMDRLSMFISLQHVIAVRVLPVPGGPWNIKWGSSCSGPSLAPKSLSTASTTPSFTNTSSISISIATGQYTVQAAASPLGHSSYLCCEEALLQIDSKRN